MSERVSTEEQVSIYRDRLAQALYATYGQEDRERSYRIADAVLAVPNPEMDALRAENDRLREERDLAVAHDRQPYPTQWAYDQAVAALEKHRQRAERAETDLSEAQKKIENLSARFTGVKIHALRLRDRITDPETTMVLNELFGALINPPPGDTPDQPDDDLTKGVIDDLTPDEIASFMSAVNDDVTPEPRSGS